MLRIVRVVDGPRTYSGLTGAPTAQQPASVLLRNSMGGRGHPIVSNSFMRDLSTTWVLVCICELGCSETSVRTTIADFEAICQIVNELRYEVEVRIWVGSEKSCKDAVVRVYEVYVM